MGLADGIAWEKEGQVGVKIVSGQGEMKKTEFGANREANDGRGRFDLFPYEAMEALAKWYEAGANKYEERNWEKGISVKDCINRMNRHALKAANGWTDEDHLAAVMWNAAAAITMMKRRPDCNDHPWQANEDNKIDLMCNTLNAQASLSRQIYTNTGNKRELDLSEILYELQVLVRTMEEKIDPLLLFSSSRDLHVV